MTKKFINELKLNEEVDDVFVLRDKNLKLAKNDKPYLYFSLQDRTGKIQAYLWDDPEQYNKKADTGDAVKIKGVVKEYRGNKQLTVSEIEKADERSFSREDLVRTAENMEQLKANIIGNLKSIRNPWIKKLSETFLDDNEVMENFYKGLGGKSWHNAYIGGLMEHTYEVMAVSDKVCELYGEADRDTVIFGAFIHDIGKIYELDYKNMEYTVEGGLLGHIAIGHRMLSEKIKKIKDFPSELRLRLEHIVLSHHGEYEQQSPVLPKTLEATIIYQTDELVSQANAVKEIKLAQQGEGKIWSDFVNIKNRKYYIRNFEEDQKGRNKESGLGELFKEG